jgi:hypothetical protein
VAQGVEHLLCKREAPSSINSPTHKINQHSCLTLESRARGPGAGCAGWVLQCWGSLGSPKTQGHPSRPTHSPSPLGPASILRHDVDVDVDRRLSLARVWGTKRALPPRPTWAAAPEPTPVSPPPRSPGPAAQGGVQEEERDAPRALGAD